MHAGHFAQCCFEQLRGGGVGWGGWVLCTACVAEEFSVSEERDIIGARRTLWAMLF